MFVYLKLIKSVRFPNKSVGSIFFFLFCIMGTESLQINSFTNSQSNVLNSVVKIPVTIDENVIDGAKEILKVIRPSWSPDNIKFKV